MFVGRIKEYNEIKNAIEEPNNHVIIYGNRRVGKTTLANKVANDSKLMFVSFECLKSSLKDNVDALVKLLYENSIIPSILSFENIVSLFQYVDSLGQRIVIVIDEYPYLYVKNDNDVVDSMFQTIVDKFTTNLNIIFSGSHIGMMKRLIKEGNPLFGRMKSIVSLKELNYLEASSFYPNLSNYDKMAFYCVFGGSPFILKQLDYKKSLEENIKNTYLNTMSSINLFISENYTSDVPTKNMAGRIFEIINNSKEKHNQIEKMLGYEHNGLLSKQLDTLVEMEFLEKNEPINKIGDKKKTTYCIRSNALRFYFSFVYGKNNTLSLIGKDEFYDLYIKNGIRTFISHRFEDVSKSFISLMVQKQMLKGIYNIGSYYYDDSITKTNGEFDLALQTSDGFDIIEVKFMKNKVDKSIINKEIEQIKKIKELNIKNYGFISINGFDDDTPEMKYKFDGNDMFSV